MIIEDCCGWNPSSLIYHHVTDQRDVTGRFIAVCGTRIWRIRNNDDQGRRECQRCRTARGQSREGS